MAGLSGVEAVGGGGGTGVAIAVLEDDLAPVSYTHLTLPTTPYV